MTINLISSLASVAAVLATSSAIAQTINGRVMRQQTRIEELEAAGQLTKSQAQQLMSAENHVLGVESLMRWQYGGDLSQPQRQVLQKLADQNSAAISIMSHGDARAAVRGQ
jgi:hypothetical protein